MNAILSELLVCPMCRGMLRQDQARVASAGLEPRSLLHPGDSTESFVAVLEKRSGG